MTLCVLPTCRTHADVEPGAMTCEPCRLHLVRQLGEIETYLDIVSPLPGRSGSSGPIGRQFASRPPLRLDVVAMLDRRTEINGPGKDDVMDEIPNVWADIDGWARVLLAENLDVFTPTFPVGATSNSIAAQLAALLRSRCDWICRQPWVDEMAKDVARVHSALRRACGDAPPRSMGRCLDMACGGEVFRRGDDPRDPRLRCAVCRTTYDGLDLVKVRSAP